MISRSLLSLAVPNMTEPEGVLSTSDEQITPCWSLGIMSGTSLDAIDLALVQTDGETVHQFGDWLSVPLPGVLQDQLREVMRGSGDWLAVEDAYTREVAGAVNRFCERIIATHELPALLGFHGQTIIHRPEEGLTWQMGNPSLLATLTGLPVIADFRRADMAAGGQGAPLVPLYHAARLSEAEDVTAVVNIGGVANITWVEPLSGEIYAFDTGPGNALLNDWIYRHTGALYDPDGYYAAQGSVNEEILQSYAAHPYLQQRPPKSLDRHDFNLDPVEGLSLEDAAATLTALTAYTIARACDHLPYKAQHHIITGGGRLNPALMRELSHRLPLVEPVEALGWRGDALEAEAFAYLAVRSRRRLPLTLPTTTGVTQPQTGGAYYSRPAGDSP